MRLGDLLDDCRPLSVSGSLDLEISGIEYDSRRVRDGSLFVAIAGAKVDGNGFVRQAIAAGARAIVSSRPASLAQPDAAWIVVPDAREALASIAEKFYGDPSRQLSLIGITGTNGKTTTTYLVEAILRAAGSPAAVFGTIEYRGPGFAFEAERTTPEAPDLEKLLRQVADAGWKYSVMEVSSHAIELRRVHALHFEVAVFTNLSRDHLDFHGDMRSYFLAKKRLFEGMGGGTPRIMVLNMDDSNYQELRNIAPTRVISYGLGTAADVHPISHHFGSEGTEARFASPVGPIELRTRLIGTPNLFNTGAAIGVAAGLGIPAETIRKGLEAVHNVPGRFEPVIAGQPFRVIVDYAHTDDALRKLLTSGRELTRGALIVVFGCGGDRDQTKRPLMGEAAGQLADFSVITSDNPRTEDPLSIIGEVESGLKPTGGKYLIQPDRRQAIRAALRMASPGDTVIIAGKGHETYQTIGKQNLPFDDKAVARELLDEFDAG